ncbi:hypothetical protein OBBRIDRAFT_732908 [Obba rivulosa]|uniref:DUF6533 domain-containing protein n=1 Tax=Obba rivulosa TaxID=1052685 RepID=A0A8E2AWA1_9APHY|nr:hypothetical protein OBBRIDRAFT_732908 [Obba rivulosa]
MSTFRVECSKCHGRIEFFSALYWYDLCLTFSEEVQDIWKAKFAFPTFLFYVLRYLPLLDTAFTIAEGYPQPKQSYLVPRTPRTAFVALRMYALFPRRPWLSVLVLLLGLINPAIGIVSICYFPFDMEQTNIVFTVFLRLTRTDSPVLPFLRLREQHTH